MSTKIDSTPTAAVLPAALERLSKARAAYADGVAAATSRSDDTVQITGDAMKMQDVEKSLSSSPSFDAGRVAAVRAAIAEGRYPIDPARIASRLMASDASLG